MSKNFKLRRLKRKDWRDMYEYGSDPETTKYLRWGPYKTEEEAKESNKMLRKNADQVFAIIVHGKMVGTVSFLNITDKKAEVGYVINKDFREMGIGTMALTSLLNFGFRWHRGKEFYAFVDKKNIPSQGLLKKCGFKKKKEVGNDYHFVFKN